MESQCDIPANIHTIFLAWCTEKYDANVLSPEATRTQTIYSV